MADSLNIDYPVLSQEEILEIYAKMGMPVSKPDITSQFQDVVSAIISDYRKRGGTLEQDCPFLKEVKAELSTAFDPLMKYQSKKIPMFEEFYRNQTQKDI